MFKLFNLIIFLSVFSLAATTYNKSLSDGTDTNLNYWTDTTNISLTDHSLAGSTEVFSLGSRKNIPTITNPSLKVYTNKLCYDDSKDWTSCSKINGYEDRYTDNGINVTGEPKLRKWFVINTPKSINGVIDNPCSSLNNTDSITPWTLDAVNERCSRTIYEYVDKITTTTTVNKVGWILKQIDNEKTDWRDGYYDFKTDSTFQSTTKILSSVSKNDPVLNNVYYTIKLGQWTVYKAGTNNTYCKMFFDNSFSSKYDKNISATLGNEQIISIIYDSYDGSNSDDTGTSSGYYYAYEYKYICSDVPIETTTLTCPATYTDNGTNCKKVVNDYYYLN